MRVEVAYAAAERQVLVALDVDEGVTVEAALRQAACHAAFEGLNLSRMPVGVYGKRVDRGRLLRPGDRIELYRPLLIDPKEARRRRAFPSRCATRVVSGSRYLGAARRAIRQAVGSETRCPIET